MENQNDQDEQVALLRLADFGDEVDQFLKSRVGQYVLQMAMLHSEEAIEELKKCDPEDAKKVRSLQNKIKVAEDIQQWLKEAVAKGLQAMDRLDEGYHED